MEHLLIFKLLFLGRLAPEELKSCLVSVGYSIGKDRQGELDFQRILAVVDPNNTGKLLILILCIQLVNIHSAFDCKHMTTV